MHNTKGNVALTKISRETNYFNYFCAVFKAVLFAFLLSQYVLSTFLNFGSYITEECTLSLMESKQHIILYLSLQTLAGRRKDSSNAKYSRKLNLLHICKFKAVVF